MPRQPNIEKLIALGERDFLDFKGEHHKSPGRLLHDIICLANADHHGDRFLLLGVRDDGTVVGVENDPGRRRIEGIQDLVGKSRLNHLPVLALRTTKIDGHEVDALVIRNRPHKPYFLLQDYELKDGKGGRLRAGAVYSRNGSTNVAIDGTADDLRLARMFEERFGLRYPPVERLNLYVQNTREWKHGITGDGKDFFRYEPFPEFVLEQGGERGEEPFDEPWTRLFPDASAHRDIYYFKYHQTQLDEVFYIRCDGGRFATTLPNVWVNPKPPERPRSYYLIKDSLNWFANRILGLQESQSSEPYISGVIAHFSSKEQAIARLRADYHRAKRRFTFFLADEESRTVECVRGTLAESVRGR